VLRTVARGDEQCQPRFVHPGGVPHVHRVHHGLTRSQLDHVVPAVEILHDVDATREQDDDLFAGRVPFPAVPRRALGDDADEPPLLPVGGEPSAVGLDMLRSPPRGSVVR
jgi:hypothetical protein